LQPARLGAGVGDALAHDDAFRRGGFVDGGDFRAAGSVDREDEGLRPVNRRVGEAAAPVREEAPDRPAFEPD
jgi:hypothetical protein